MECGGLARPVSPPWWALALLLCASQTLVSGCPHYCFCDNINLAVSCVNRNLTEVPVTIPEITKRLDVRKNTIKEIPSGAFLVIPYLTHLNLQQCEIHTIQEGAFRGLGRLVYLNLGSNLISILYQESFDGLSSLQQLIVEKNRIEEIQPGAFSQLGFLNFLNLGENFLVFLPNMVFQGLQNIKWIRLSHNSLNNLAEETFAGLFTLKRLSLDHNELQFFPTQTLSRLTELVRLDFGTNPITYLGEEAVAMPKLKQLFLDNMSLQDISYTSLEKAPQLTMADFSKNQLRVLQPLMGPEKLVKVNLTGNPILCNCYMRPFREWMDSKHIRVEAACFGPSAFRGERLDSMRPIDLRCDSRAAIEEQERQELLIYLTPPPELDKNKIKCPESCDCKTELQHSTCEGKNLRKIPKGFPEDTKLLDLRRNDFFYVPKNAFSTMRNVVSLHLQKCQISELEPSAFNGMKKLVYLYLSENELSTINPTALQGIPQLTYLYLDRNKFSVFPTGAFKLVPNLFSLHLQYNSITHLPDNSLEQAKKLRCLYLTGNHLSFMAPSSLAAADDLEKLFLDDNQLNEVPTQVLGSSPILDELRLSGNPIRWVGAGAFLPMANSLRHLYLNRMGLEKLSSVAFSGLGRGIKSLYLENNQLENLPSLTNFTGLEVINLADNPLHCDCSLLHLHKWINKVNLKVRASCSSPPEMRGRKVKDAEVFKNCSGVNPEKDKPKESIEKAGKAEGASPKQGKVEEASPKLEDQKLKTVKSTTPGKRSPEVQTKGPVLKKMKSSSKLTTKRANPSTVKPNQKPKKT